MLITKNYQLKISDIGEEILCEYEKKWLEEFSQDILDFEVYSRLTDPGMAGHKIAPSDREIELDYIRVPDVDKEILYRKLLDAMSPMIGVAKYVQMCVAMDISINALIDSDDCAADMMAVAVRFESNRLEMGVN